MNIQVLASTNARLKNLLNVWGDNAKHITVTVKRYAWQGGTIPVLNGTEWWTIAYKHNSPESCYGGGHTLDAAVESFLDKHPVYPESEETVFTWQ